MIFRWLWLLSIIIPLQPAFARGKPQTPLPPLEIALVTTEPSATEVVNRGETILRTLAKAYPDRIGEIEYRDGDWSIQVYGERFYFAEGRLLPASLLAEKSEYSSVPFYNYQKELPPWVQPTVEESNRMRDQERQRGTQQIRRPALFYDTLWRARSRDEAWDRVKQIRFLGQNILVHYSILSELSLVEEHIMKAAKTNASIRQWVNNLDTIQSWNWRNVASGQSRSYHAYGAAIDLLPKSLGGLQTYWLWTAQHTPDWWTVPYTRRYHPPEEVIKIFESFGFIWGGKWRYYDTMHFEYRPEIIDLSGIERTNLRELR
ncbi:MAG: M15 family metallopeptidase [Treponema sp.]|jgi:hypothetical protein|nr:M15 family metallopeptidase [Treponema sp.]